MIKVLATVEEQRWLENQLKPLPDVIVLAYAGIGGGVMSWKVFDMFTNAEWSEKECEINLLVNRAMPSAICISVIRVGKDKP